MSRKTARQKAVMRRNAAYQLIRLRSIEVICPSAGCARNMYAPAASRRGDILIIHLARTALCGALQLALALERGKIAIHRGQADIGKLPRYLHRAVAFIRILPEKFKQLAALPCLIFRHD